MKNQNWAIFASLTLLLCVLALTPANSQDTGELQKRFEAVNKVVQDPLTDESGIRKALSELESLTKVTQEFEEGDLKPGDPKAELAKSIVNTLREVESRLPEGFQSRLEMRPGFPVPEFDDRKLLARNADELHEAQKRLARLIRRDDSAGPQTEELLHAVSVAQESLAWEAGWPFTKEEAEAVRAAGRLTEKVYLSRLKRGITRINEQIDREFDANGRPVERPFTVHVSAEDSGKEQFARHLAELRKLESFPKEVFREFDKEQAEILKGEIQR